MQITETKTVTREVHVAPCLKCGSTDIVLTDSNYSSCNTGGGLCKKCGHTSFSGVGCLPSMDQLASNWNAENDIPTLISAEEAKIAASTAKIEQLQATVAARSQQHDVSPVP